MKATHTVRTEAQASYQSDDDAIISRALEIINNRLQKPGAALCSPGAVRDFLRIHLSEEKSEVFSCIFLDSKHAVIAFETLFHGSIGAATVYPREVVKAALKHNAAAMILAHNHPSGDTEPSSEDMTLTKRLKESLSMIDVQVLDHFIVGGSKDSEIFSFAEHSYI